MNDLVSDRFGYRTPYVLCVIHVLTPHQATDNAEVARDAGADGVFLIDHAGGIDGLREAARAVRQAHPALWIGCNFLGELPTVAARQCVELGLDGVWADDIRDDDPIEVRRELERAGPRRPLYFAGVEFKYRTGTGDPARAAVLAAELVDVVTTSGPGTGQAADPRKLELMRSGAPDARLALASGVTPENIHAYIPTVDAVLVASGISSSFYDLDAGRVRELVAAARPA